MLSSRVYTAFCHTLASPCGLVTLKFQTPHTLFGTQSDKENACLQLRGPALLFSVPVSPLFLSLFSLSLPSFLLHPFTCLFPHPCSPLIFIFSFLLTPFWLPAPCPALAILMMVGLLLTHLSEDLWGWGRAVQAMCCSPHDV